MEVSVQGCVILVQLIPQAPRAQEDAFMARQQLQAGGAQYFRLGQACQSKACTEACLTPCTDLSVQASSCLFCLQRARITWSTEEVSAGVLRRQPMLQVRHRCPSQAVGSSCQEGSLPCMVDA